MSIRASSAKWPPSHRDRSISAGYSDSKFSLPSTSAFSQHPFFPNSASSRPLSCSILETGKTGNHVYVIQPSIDCGIFFRHFWQPLMSCRRSLHPTQRPSTRPPSQALILSPTAESPPIGSSFLTYCAHRHPVAPPPLRQGQPGRVAVLSDKDTEGHLPKGEGRNRTKRAHRLLSSAFRLRDSQHAFCFSFSVTAGSEKQQAEAPQTASLSST